MHLLIIVISIIVSADDKIVLNLKQMAMVGIREILIRRVWIINPGKLAIIVEEIADEVNQRGIY